MPRSRNEQRETAGDRWDNEGGAAPSTDVSSSEDRGDDQSAKGRSQSAIDASYESSTRGEHRYPDAHQPPAAQQEREDRDKLKRALRGDR